MAATLTISGDREARFTLEPGGEVHVGRVETAQLCIDDLRVSRDHCKLELGELGVTVSDLKSANGVFVNGEQVSRALLRSGDKLQVGPAWLTVELSYDPRLAPPPQRCSLCDGDVVLDQVPAGVVIHLDEPFVCPSCRNPDVTVPLSPREVTIIKLLSQEGFEALTRLSIAGVAPIYKARKRSLDQLVAIKALLLAATNASLKKRIDRFLQEAKAGARLRHPNVVTVFDMKQTENLVYIVMELIEGTTLQQKVERTGPMVSRDALRVGYQIARALDHLHERKVIHRDVTPSNIMLTPEGDAKLIDLGSAKNLWDEAAESITGEGQTLGTLGFIAPEQLRHAKRADARADIYSLGATLYYCLLGEAPLNELRQEKSATSLSLPRFDKLEAAPDVVEVIGKLMHPQPDQRFQTAREVLARIDEIVSNMSGLGDLRGNVEFYLRLRDDQVPLPRQKTRRAANAIHGKFSSTELSDFLTMLELNQKAGVLEVSGDDWRGKLHFVNGRIVASEAWHASRFKGGSVFEAPTHRGKAAVLILLGVRRGNFEFVPKLEAVPHECDLAVTSILLEALKNRDEHGP